MLNKLRDLLRELTLKASIFALRDFAKNILVFL